MSTQKTYPIVVGKDTFAPNQQVPESAAFVSALAFAHRKDITRCLCEPSRPVQLVVKHYGSGTKGAHYGLARWQGTGLDHALDCQFFSEEVADSDAGASRPAFEDLDGGRIRVHLARPLGLAQPGATTQPRHPGKDTPAASHRQRANDTALLFKLWRCANLNIHRGREAGWFNASLRLVHAASTLVIDRVGNTLEHRLLVGAEASGRKALAHNAQVLEQAARAPGRLFVIGRLKVPTTAQQAKAQFLLPLRDFAGLPRILVTAQMLHQFLAKRALLQNLLQRQDGNVVVICCIEPASREWWKCIDIAGMATSRTMIPVESSYEITMADHLVAQSRTFVKPLHADEMRRDEDQRPDFILLDTLPRTVIEVWGMQTDEYLKNKALRLAKYREKAIPVLSWDAARGDALPPLPPVTRPPAPAPGSFT
ncbi:DUF1173 family protein [Noviherbaspirillum pedocola]|uniref:DUF1173 family protein n=1 Tax=Noviherbaspirillum pedocola TaxID=2801341 RepID=A0A934SVL0_9BURK|nr:DUF1173 family protein [Noviherbaspirillum pedocola]MBK4735951.1 DUF1173 family protein [Noviherbaspirillum pedocola]